MVDTFFMDGLHGSIFEANKQLKLFGQPFRLKTNSQNRTEQTVVVLLICSPSIEHGRSRSVHFLRITFVDKKDLSACY